MSATVPISQDAPPTAPTSDSSEIQSQRSIDFAQPIPLRSTLQSQPHFSKPVTFPSPRPVALDRRTSTSIFWTVRSRTH
jgi:hypothetical protein